MRKKKQSPLTTATKKVKKQNSKENQLSEKSQDFLKLSKTLFGGMLTAFIEKRLKKLSEEKQFDLAWNILHYMCSDEILPTGDPVIDIKLSEIIKELPSLNVDIFRYLFRQKYGNFKKAPEKPQFIN